MSNWRSGNHQDDEKLLLSSDGNADSGNRSALVQGGNNPMSNFPGSNYSHPSQPGHYSSPIQNSQYPPVGGNISSNPPQYKASNSSSPNVSAPITNAPAPAPTYMPPPAAGSTPACLINITYPIIQKMTNINEIEAMNSQFMVCPFCHKNIKTGFRYVPGDSAYFMAAICCILLGLIGLVIALCCDTFQDIEHFCPNCQSVLKKYTR